MHGPRAPATYEIRVRGRLGSRWAEWLGGMDVAWARDGSTILTGPVADQAALHGLLRRLRDLGVTLISIHVKEDSMASHVQGLRGDRKMVLSTLWIFGLINCIYADIFTAFFNPASPGSVTMPQSAVLTFAVLMETGIAMVLLSRVLPRAWNRWLNVAIGLLQAGFVTWSLLGDPPKPFYVFFVCIEVATFLFIAGYALAWRKEPSAA
jgi:hypothetical protein